MDALSDSALFTPRFSGWDSYRQIFTRYIEPTLTDDVATTEAAIRRWAPDVVVASTYSPSGRLAASALGIRVVTVSIYPDHRCLAGRRTAWAGSYQRAIRELAGPEHRSSDLCDSFAWGLDHASVVLTDPLFIEQTANVPQERPVGYPYWDAIPSSTDEEHRALDWLSRPGPPVVVATLGSFIGAAPTRLWDILVAAARSSGARLLVVNGLQRGIRERVDGTPDALSVGYVRLSTLLPNSAAVVHHGGLGTTVATLRACQPSVVVPQAFDQPGIARRVEALGVGLMSSMSALPSTLAEVLENDRMRRRAEAVSEAMVPATDAAHDAAKMIQARAG